MRRRDFIKTIGLGGAFVGASASPLSQLASAATKKAEIKAIVFDAFPVFDPRPIFGLIKSIVPEHKDFGKSWFGKIFAYTWLRTSGAHYSDFYSVIEQALDYTAQQYGVTFTSKQKTDLMGVWMTLKPWSDIPETLEMLEQKNIRLAFLSNFTEKMLRTNARNGGLEKKFDYLSTDRVNAFKPAPKAYQMGIEHFGLRKEEIAFCAFAAWDAAGASWFGYPTVWINRLGQRAEHLNQGSIVSGKGMNTLQSFVRR